MYHLAFFFIDLQMTYSYKDFFSQIIVLRIIMRSSVESGTYPSQSVIAHLKGAWKSVQLDFASNVAFFEKEDSKWSDPFLSCVEMRLLEFHWRLSLFKNKVFCSQSFSLFLVNTYCFTHHQQLIQWTRRWGVVI